MVADSAGASAPAKVAEVRRLLDRYIVEIVETYNFCPWARSARTNGEISVAVLFGQPTVDEWVRAGRELLARPETRVAMVVGPEVALTTDGFRAMREQVARQVEIAGIAEFHPDAELDMKTPPRLVPFTRRSPDPLMQFVPIKLLSAVRTATMTPLSEQARALGGIATDAEDDIGDQIAATNHARVKSELAAIEAVLADIAADRRRSYPRVGIAIGTAR